MLEIHVDGPSGSAEVLPAAVRVGPIGMPGRSVSLVPETATGSDYYGHGRDDIMGLVPSDVRRLLDVGCAGGEFGARMMQKRPEMEVWGIEPVAEIAARAVGKLSRVICKGVEDALADLPDGSFDFITFNDVLEHLVDPWTVLRSVQSKLAPGGSVLASIPNLRYFPVMKSLVFGGDFEYAAQGVLDRTHLRFFTKKSMQRLLRDSGYVVTRVDGLQWTRFPFSLSVLNRLTRRSIDDMHYPQFAIQAKPEVE